ncbi:hypothetical protein PPACK8108_LOCUS5673 [Phakopsora pachyrhizi]|uniref:Uncharacterized protein n=1 Tax=Phakopsora pachyrhizi TaxID=170000 RepID=A0AAV0ARD9_PHAPC|nr:hypothetical protein PPACK8108_LOCUS5673 [Phakopsora pachyrhizi]
MGLGWGSAGSAGAWLSFAGLGPGQVGQARTARAHLGFAGLGPGWVGQDGQVKGRLGRWGRPGLGLPLLGWVMGRWGSWGRLVGKGRADRLVEEILTNIKFTLGKGQALLGWGRVGLVSWFWLSRGRSAGRLGRWGRPGLGLALLGWVLGRAGQVSRLAGLAGQAGQARAARAWLGKKSIKKKRLVALSIDRA